MFAAFVLVCSQTAEIDPLVQAERSFAAAVKQKGLKAGFLSVMDEDSLLFRPGPVPGKKTTQEGPDSPAILEWEPAVAAITKSGNYGFTTGPWQVLPKAGEEPVAFGHYLSAWKKTPEGWRLILDCGTATTEVPVQQYSVKALLFGTPVAESDLKSTAKKFAEGQSTLAPSMTDPFAVAFWTGDAPAMGPKTIAAMGKAYPVTDVNVLSAKSYEEMGIAYGTFKSKPGPGHFVQIWRTDSTGPKLLSEMYMVDPKPQS